MRENAKEPMYRTAGGTLMCGGRTITYIFYNIDKPQIGNRARSRPRARALEDESRRRTLGHAHKAFSLFTEVSLIRDICTHTQYATINNETLKRCPRTKCFPNVSDCCRQFNQNGARKRKGDRFSLHFFVLRKWDKVFLLLSTWQYAHLSRD